MKDVYLNHLIDQNSLYKGESKKDLEKFFKMFVQSLKEECLEATDHNVVITGLGSFRLKKYSSTKHHNVNTGEMVEVPARYKLTFSASEKFDELIMKTYGYLEDDEDE